jgi:putative SOS response-associated peptidase YedK
MCGRFGRIQEHERVERHFDIAGWNAATSYNIAPQSVQPVIILAGERREVRLMRWGLVPYWAKDPKIGFTTFNARAEDIATKPAFREAIQQRRCLVPADFFYEWQTIGKHKQPFAISMKNGEIFAFAGIWDTWQQADIQLDTFALITATANPIVKQIHDRMPVIVQPEDYGRWLSPAAPTRLPVDLLKALPDNLIKFWPVNARVGNVRNDDAALIVREESHSLF